MEHFLATGEGPVLGKRIELTALRRTGEEFPVELTIAPIQWGRAGSSARSCAISRSASEPKQNSSERLLS
jgi:hypothetical protein